MTDVAEVVSQHWNLTPVRIEAVGPVWKVSTETGAYCLKPGKHGIARLLFDYHAIEWLSANGFSGTPRLISTMSGTPFANTPAGDFALQHWVGRPLNPQSRAEWIAAARELARFHRASEGMVVPADVPHVTFSGKWSKRFALRHRDMQQAFQSSPPLPSDFQAEVLDKSEAVLQLATRAMTILQNSEYERLVAELHTRPVLVHGNVKAENFTVDTSGRLHVIDFDSFRFDVSVQDVSDLLLAALPAHDWSLPLAQQMLAAYESERPLTPAEVPVLLALMTFPYKPYKVMHKLQEPGRPLEKSRRKWRLAVQDLDAQNEFLMKKSAWLKNRVK